MKRVNKRVARRLFNEGKIITVFPCKANPRSPWWFGMEWDRNYLLSIGEDGDFDKLCNTFTYYNCNYETGYYPAFYVEEVKDND